MQLRVQLVLASLFILAFFFNRGFAYYDEGFILHAAQRVLQGEIPYKDFDLIYTPGTVLLTAAAFKLFGESILAGRVLALLVALLTCYLVYTVCYRTTKNYLGSLLAVLIYLAWGPTHINFPWPSMFALSAGLAALWILPNIFFAGFITAIVFLMKQNFGVAMLLTAVFGMVLMKQNRQKGNMFKFFIGLAAGILFFLIYLVLTGSLMSFLNNFYFYTIKRFLLEGMASTPYPSGLKGLFYLLPGIISVMAIFVAYKRQSKSIVLPIFTLLFYIFGIRPTTDYPHLVVLISITGLPIAVILKSLTTILDALQKSSLTRMTSFWHFDSAQCLELVERLVQNLFTKGVYGLIFLIIFLGFYTAFFKNYYRWDSPMIKQKFFISERKAKIFVDRKFNEIIPSVISEIRKHGRDGDYIFIYPNAPMFYFLTDRKNPTRFINLPQDLHTREQEEEVIRALGNKKVKLILTNEASTSWHYALISRYIQDNFAKKKEIFEFSFWERK